jgi:hypothetical protein
VGLEVFHPGRRILGLGVAEVEIWGSVLEDGIGWSSKYGELGLRQGLIRSGHCGRALDIYTQRIHVVASGEELDGPPVTSDVCGRRTHDFGMVGMFFRAAHPLDLPREAGLPDGLVLGIIQVGVEVLLPVVVYPCQLTLRQIGRGWDHTLIGTVVTISRRLDLLHFCLIRHRGILLYLGPEGMF